MIKTTLTPNCNLIIKKKLQKAIGLANDALGNVLNVSGATEYCLTP